jgi:hypothetical protein
MRALSIRQPYAELILRGLKSVEFRSRPTRIIGQRFWIYASLKTAGIARAGSWSSELRLDEVPSWMLDVADGLKLFPESLPRGLIVGSAVIDRVSPWDAADGLGYEGLWRWHLRDIERCDRPMRPRGQPQPVWWVPGSLAG